LTLSELLAVAAVEVNEAIRAVDTELRDLEGRRKNNESVLEEARGQIRRARGVVEERRRACDEIDERVKELERQLRDVERRLSERRGERDSARAELHAAESAGATKKKDVQTAEEEGRRISEAIDRAISARATHESRIRDRHRHAFCEYQGALWKRLLELATSQGERARQAGAYAAFENARRNDTEVAGLDEAHREWRKIAASAVAPAVKSAAKSELDRIEAQIESRFPGALEFERTRGLSSEIEEFYFLSSEDRKVQEIYVPIPESVYSSLGEGGSGREDDLAMRLAWSLIQALHPVPESAEFLCAGGLCVLRVESDAKSVGDAAANLGGPIDGSIAIVLSPIPDVVREAISDED
jgi:DNA repair exonuclease SbcCD ATPase subunit